MVLLRISAAMARRDDPGLREAFASDVLRGVEQQVDEVILQAGLFLGYPAVLDAFSLWAGARCSMPVRPEVPRPTDWEERGSELCRRVYGAAYENLRSNVSQLHPDLDYGMIVDGYGRILSRPGLPLRERELNVVVVLTAARRWRQLHSHLRGALRAGALPDEVESAMEIGARDLDDASRSRLFETWASVRSRTKEEA